jgi:RNA polymerase sigma-70 factor (ECF subfamily)
VLYVAKDEAATEPGDKRPSTAESTFADLLEANLERLYGYCVRLTGDPHDAEDLVQETLLRAVRARSALRDPGRTKSWLFTIATNRWKDLGRARGREVTTTPLDAVDEDDRFSLFQTIAIEDPFPYSDELHLDFLRLFRDEDVQAVFATITPAFRAPLILTIIHGFACKEAAAILDIPVGTLLSRLHRGRKQLERGLWDYAVRNSLITIAGEDEP